MCKGYREENLPNMFRGGEHKMKCPDCGVEPGIIHKKGCPVLRELERELKKDRDYTWIKESTE